MDSWSASSRIVSLRACESRNGSFGWDGAYGTQTWIDPKEKMVTIVMIQTQVTQVQRDFENAVMQAIVECQPSMAGWDVRSWTELPECGHAGAGGHR